MGFIPDEPSSFIPDDPGSTFIPDPEPAFQLPDLGPLQPVANQLADAVGPALERLPRLTAAELPYEKQMAKRAFDESYAGAAKREGKMFRDYVGAPIAKAYNAVVDAAVPLVPGQAPVTEDTAVAMPLEQAMKRPAVHEHADLVELAHRELDAAIRDPRARPKQKSAREQEAIRLEQQGTPDALKQAAEIRADIGRDFNYSQGRGLPASLAGDQSQRVYRFGAETGKSAFQYGIAGLTYLGDKTRGAIHGTGRRGADIVQAWSEGDVPVVREMAAFFDGFAGETGKKVFYEAAGAVLEAVEDPVTYTGVGPLTRLGQAAKAKRSQEIFEKVTGMSAPIGDRLSDILKRATPDATEFGEALSEQAARGQRNMVTFMGKRVLPKKADELMAKALSGVGEGVRSVPLVTKFGGSLRIRPLMTPAQRWALEASGFSRSHTLALEAQAARVFESDLKGLAQARGTYDRVADKAQDETLSQLFEKGSKEELESRLRDGVKAGSISNYEYRFAMEKRRQFDELLQRERSRAVPTPELDESDLTYMTHGGRQEFRDFIKKLEPKLTPTRRLESSIDPNFLKTRKLRDMSAVEVNDHIRQRLAKKYGIDPATIPDAVHTDLATAYYARRLASIKATSATDLETALLSKFSAPSATAPRDWVPLPKTGPAGQRYAGAEDMRIPPELSKILEGIGRARRDPNELERLYDGVTKWWISWSLSVRPGFTTRNAASAIHNVYLSGKAGLGEFNDVARMLADSEHVAKGAIDIGGRRVAVREFLDLAEATGASRTEWSKPLEKMREKIMDGVYGKEPPNGAKDAVVRAIRRGQQVIPWIAIDKANSAYLRLGAAVADLPEKHSRLALFLGAMRSGDGPAEAAMLTKKYLFDAGELTEVERQLFQRAMPFWGWLRNNAGLQLATAATKPGKYAWQARAINALQADDAPPEEAFPMRTREMGLLRLGPVKDGKANAAWLTGAHPAMDIGRLGEAVSGGLAGQLASNLGPVPKILAAAAGVQLPGSLTATAGPAREVAGTLLPSRVAAAVEAAAPVSALDIPRYNPGGLFGRRANEMRGIPGKPPEVGALNWLGYLLEQGQTYPTSDVRMRSDIPHGYGLMSFLGVPVREFDLEDSARLETGMRESAERERSQQIKRAQRKGSGLLRGILEDAAAEEQEQGDKRYKQLQGAGLLRTPPY